MEISEIAIIILVCMGLASSIVLLLGLWVYAERKRSARRLRELRDAMSEISKH